MRVSQRAPDLAGPAPTQSTSRQPLKIEVVLHLQVLAFAHRNVERFTKSFHGAP
jgi:hypothetical protein